MDYSVGNGRMYVLVNETADRVGGQMCHLDARTHAIVGTRSTCYKVRKELSDLFPDQRYVVYRLVRLGRKK